MRHPGVGRHPHERVGRRVIEEVERQDVYASVRSLGPGCPSAAASERLIAWFAIEAVRRSWQGYLGSLKHGPSLRPGNVGHPGRRHTMGSGDDDTGVGNSREGPAAPPKKSRRPIQQ